MTQLGRPNSSASPRKAQRSPRLKMKDPLGVSQILSQALRHSGIDKEIARYKFVLHWQEIVGDKLSKISKPEMIRGKSLVVRVANSAWAQELSFHKELLLKRLRPHLESELELDDITFYVG